MVLPRRIGREPHRPVAGVRNHPATAAIPQSSAAGLGSFAACRNNSHARTVPSIRTMSEALAIRSPGHLVFAASNARAQSPSRRAAATLWSTGVASIRNSATAGTIGTVTAATIGRCFSGAPVCSETSRPDAGHIPCAVTPSHHNDFHPYRSGPDHEDHDESRPIAVVAMVNRGHHGIGEPIPRSEALPSTTATGSGDVPLSAPAP